MIVMNSSASFTQQENQPKRTSKFAEPILALVLLVGLYLASRHNYLLFHSIAEIASIVIGVSIFFFIWNARRYLENHFLLFLGISYLFIAILDLFHTLAYKGMGVFPGYDVNLPTQLWIATRSLQSISLLFAFVYLRRRLVPGRALFFFFLATALILASIFTGFFPDCFLQSGLTGFKIYAEYAIVLIYLAAIVLLQRQRKQFDSAVMRLLMVSFSLSIATELAFTLYTDVYGILNMVGHYLKVLSFLPIYQAVLYTGIQQPLSILFRDLRQARDELQYMATHDSLTTLPNRNLFFHQIEHAIRMALRNKKMVAVLFIDIDNLKHINDTYGHDAGDQLLQINARRMTSLLRSSDIVYRFGGDEFILTLENITNRQDAEVVTRKVLNKLSEPVIIDTRTIQNSASIGVSLFPEDGNEPALLLKKADIAMYTAKTSGKNRFKFYDDSDEELPSSAEPHQTSEPSLSTAPLNTRNNSPQ